MSVQTFTYQAVDAQGVVQKGTVEADSADAAASSLAAGRLVPISVTRSGQGLQRELKIPGLGGRTKLRDLAVMTRQFASLTISGLTLLRSLTILEEQTTAPKLKEALGQIRTDVESGSTLSVAMATHPTEFPELMTNLVAAGEAGGFLDQALDRIAKMYESDAALRGKIKSAATYPVVVLAFSLLMMIGVIFFIVPIFEKMFAQLGGSLPLPTQVMVTLSHNMWWVLPIVLVVAFGAWRGYRIGRRDSEEFRFATDQLKLRLPVIGSLASKLAISRWCRNLGTLLGVGVPVIQALEMVGGTSGNAVIARASLQVRDAVRGGATISGPLATHPVFPPMVIQMLEVGEETGRTSDMLDKVADFYDNEVQTATDSLTSAMEPVLVVVIGAVIGAMVLCLYLPMFSIYQQIQTN